MTAQNTFTANRDDNEHIPGTERAWIWARTALLGGAASWYAGQFLAANDKPATGFAITFVGCFMLPMLSAIVAIGPSSSRGDYSRGQHRYMRKMFVGSIAAAGVITAVGAEALGFNRDFIEQRAAIEEAQRVDDACVASGGRPARAVDTNDQLCFR